MKKETIKKLLAINTSMFPQFYKEVAEENVILQINVWYELFKDYEDEQVGACFKQALKTAQYPVKPADIFAIMAEQQKATMPTSDELFKIATDIADEMLEYHSQERGWESEWGAEKSGYEYALDIYNKLPPLLKEWKRNPNDLINWYYRIDGNGNSYDRHDFEKNINAILQRRQTLGIAWNQEVKPLFEGNVFKVIADKKQIGGNNE